MFNTKFLGKRKYAVYKQDGTRWTQEEYGTVVNLFEKPGSNQKCLNSDALIRKYISDKINEDRPMYHVWSVTKQRLEGFTKISYEELLKQSRMPLLKRRKDDSHKNETPTTPSK
jgi:hypothetical protein